VIRLVVNADDLGLHPRIDAGILRAHREGIVTSATVLATGSSAREAIAAARSQGLALGVHLCLTTRLPPAAPASEVKSLVPDGRFRAGWSDVVAAWISRRIRLEDVDREFRAQIDRARQLGAEPDHLDGHQHLHLLPGISRIVVAIAREQRLPIRWPIAAPGESWLAHPGSALKTTLIAALSFATRRNGASGLSGLGTFEAGMLNEERLLALLSRLGDGDYEVGCHPGEDVDQVPEEPDWRYRWTEELEALCSHSVRALVEGRRIALTTYRGIYRGS